MNDHDLDNALRALPRREGRSDWADLEARLSGLRPARPARRLPFRGPVRRRILSAAAALALVVGGIAGWRALSPAPETAWQQAHQDASFSDPWADPWVLAAVETSR